MSEVTPIEETMTLADAGRILGITRQRVWQYVNDGLLDTVEINGRLRILKSSVDTFVTPRGWVDMRRTFEEIVRSTITQLKTSEEKLTTGEIFGTVVKNILDSENSKYRVSKAIRN